MGGNLYRDLTKLLTEAGCTFLRQGKGESVSLADGYRQLAQILSNLETER